MSSADDILRFFGQVIAYGGGGGAVAFLLFRFLGKSWIESKFAEKLEQLRHTQALELQRLRVEIDSLLSGAIKIQEKEFETLPEAWQRLDEAYGRVASLVSPMQEYPDLDRLTGVELEEFLAAAPVTESQKDEIRGSTEKLSAYQEIIFWHRLTDVHGAISDLHNYVERNSIFFPPELKQHFVKASNELWSAMVRKEVGHQVRDHKMQNEGWTKIKDEVEPLRKTIEAAIYARLQDHGKTKPVSK